MRILSISAVYPRSAEPNLGIFVERRLQHMAELADVRVLAPIAALDYAKLRAGGSARASEPNHQERCHVLRPRWWYPPGGGILNPPLMALQLLAAVRRIRREFAFDLLDAHFAYPTGVATAMLASHLRCPFTITLRGDETMHAGKAVGRARAIDWALRRATAIFAVSNRLRDWAISRPGVSPYRAFTIPNGVDNATFRRICDVDLDDVRSQFGATSAEDSLVLSAGYLIERKGHHHLIRAVHSLLKKNEGSGRVHIVIAGEPGREGNFADHLKELTHSLGMQHRVHFLGRQSQQNLARLMNAADVLVLASSREGWPNVVQEALACGCPVVAADIGGTPDMIPDERYGYLLPPGEVQVETLADALAKALARREGWDRESIADWGSRRSWNQVALDVVARMRESLGFNLPDGTTETATLNLV